MSSSPGDRFVELIAAVLTRYCRQNEMAALPDPVAQAVGARLWILVSVRGIPPPIPAGAQSAPELAPEAVAPLVATLLEDCSRATDLATPVRQLVKACFQPERRVCRESYRETRADGNCRRQQLERVRSRVSGTHCVDCPHWNALDGAAHRELLAAAWCGDRDLFTAGRDVFLPEDFRALRRWLRSQAVGGAAT